MKYRFREPCDWVFYSFKCVYAVDPEKFLFPWGHQIGLKCKNMIIYLINWFSYISWIFFSSAVDLCVVMKHAYKSLMKLRLIAFIISTCFNSYMYCFRFSILFSDSLLFWSFLISWQSEGKTNDVVLFSKLV